MYLPYSDWKVSVVSLPISHKCFLQLSKLFKKKLNSKIIFWYAEVDTFEILKLQILERFADLNFEKIIKNRLLKPSVGHQIAPLLRAQNNCL